MPDVDAELAVVRTQILAAASRRLAGRARARLRGWLIVTIAALALAGGTVAVAAGVFDDSSATIVSQDLKRIARSAHLPHRLPKVVPGQTIHAFTKAEDGFDLDVVPTSDGGACMVIRHATAQLGTEHAETCGTRAETRVTDRPMMFIVDTDGGGAAFGAAPQGATSGVFTVRGHAVPLHVRHGYWAVRIPSPPRKPADQFTAERAIGSGRASFR